jgi:hypothetical protein
LFTTPKAANQFSLVETNAAFVHRKWAAIYEAQLPRRALKLTAALPHCQAGLEKTWVKKKNSPVGFLFFFGFFVFLYTYSYLFAQKREFL